jgi:hypothetical protein
MNVCLLIRKIMNLRMLLFAAVAFAATTLNAATPTFAPGGPLIIKDAQGQTVGQTMGPELVSVVINGRNVVLGVSRTRGLLDRGESLFFDQPNCNGTAYINRPSVQDYTYTPGEFAPDGTIRISPSFQGTSRVVASLYRDDIPECVNFTQTITALDTETGPNLKTQFHAPFVAVEGVIAPTAVPTNSPLYLLLLAASLVVAACMRLQR